VTSSWLSSSEAGHATAQDGFAESINETTCAGVVLLPRWHSLRDPVRHGLSKLLGAVMPLVFLASPSKGVRTQQDSTCPTEAAKLTPSSML
jgi:hypothetical protein